MVMVVATDRAENRAARVFAAPIVARSEIHRECEQTQICCSLSAVPSPVQ